MRHLKVDFQKPLGKIKPMHATNNGPTCDVNNIDLGWGTGSDIDPNPNKAPKKRNGNLAEFRAAGIPYARTHDSSFYPKYGLEHTVDVAFIFPNFDADPNDPASYDFTCTDHYMDMIEAAGTKVFYRLGHRIEHEVKKYGTLPPKDFHKWAVICEHIIRHYTEGWADGSYRDMKYWEIWNEPDLDADDAKNKRTWGGTKAQFFEFYHIVATHLKQCFPHLMIGGPAVSGNLEWTEDFLAQLKAPLDFFSWHVYAHTIEKIATRADKVRKLLDKYGFDKTESILNEWNYVLAWTGDEFIYSHLVKKKIKGASFNLATMCICQAGSVDMLMYYDARPTTWNGLFDMVQLGGVTTTAYYSFPMFNTLYQLGNSVDASSDDSETYLCAAVDSSAEAAAIIMTRFNDDDNTPSKFVTLDVSGFSSENGVEAEIYLLDETHKMVLTQRIVFYGDKFVWEPDIKNFDCYLIKLNKR
jgi:hypothetical protein